MRRDERGGGTVLTAGVLLSLLAVCWGACIVVSWVAQVRHGQDAADLTALAAAGAHAAGQDGCRAAEQTARRNASALAGCRIDGPRQGFVVEVVVEVPLSPAVPGSPATARRTATAGTG